MDAIESKYCEIIWWDSFNYHFGNNIEYTRTVATIVNTNKLGVPYTPNVKHVTQPVYKNCDDSFNFEWIMQSSIQIFLVDPLPVRKGPELASDYSAGGFVVQSDPNFSE
jgi:hypothetical protein